MGPVNLRRDCSRSHYGPKLVQVARFHSIAYPLGYAGRYLFFAPMRVVDAQSSGFELPRPVNETKTCFKPLSRCHATQSFYFFRMHVLLSKILLILS